MNFNKKKFLFDLRFAKKVDDDKLVIKEEQYVDLEMFIEYLIANHLYEDKSLKEIFQTLGLYEKAYDIFDAFSYIFFVAKLIPENNELNAKKDDIVTYLFKKTNILKPLDKYTYENLITDRIPIDILLLYFINKDDYIENTLFNLILYFNDVDCEFIAKLLIDKINESYFTKETFEPRNMKIDFLYRLGTINLSTKLRRLYSVETFDVPKTDGKQFFTDFIKTLVIGG